MSMPKHPYYDKYNVLSAGQVKVSDDERFAPGYTAGCLATQVLTAMNRADFKPTMRVEHVEPSATSDGLQYDNEFIPAPDTLGYLYVQHPGRRGINRFF